MNRRRWGILLAVVVLAAGIGMWRVVSRPQAIVGKARAAVIAQGIDPRLLTHAAYSRDTVQLEGPARQSDIVEFHSDIAGFVYMAYLEPSDGTLWWLDELSGEGEVCVRTTLYK